jgi:peptidoglycan/LPS O-acetylase OafA/YrhL
VTKLFNLFSIGISRNRIFGLDILRALAIIFVVIHHGNIVYIPKLYHLDKIFQLVDFDGVSIFFVLSGFLIGGILIKIVEKNPPNIKVLFDFWKRRWFRTLPNYYFVLCFLLILIPFNEVAWIENPFKDCFFIKYFFFLQNFKSPMVVFFCESWSLCVEEWFYLIVPFLIFVLIGVFKVVPKRATIMVALFIIFSVTVFRYYKYAHTDILSSNDAEYNIAYVVLTRLDSLMYGLIGAYFYFYYKERWLKNKRLLLVIGIIIFLLQKYLPLIVDFNNFLIYNYVFTFSVTSIGCLLMMPFMSEYRKSDSRWVSVLTYISLISYSMYLINLSPLVYNIIPFLSHWLIKLPFFTAIRYMIYWIFTILGAVIMYKLVELPFMRLRDRFTMKN